MLHLLHQVLTRGNLFCYQIHRYLTTTDRTVDVQGEIQYLNWVDGVPHAQNNCQFIMLKEVRRRGIISGGVNVGVDVV